MKIINKYYSRTLGFTMALVFAFLAGCTSGSSTSGTTPTVTLVAPVDGAIDVATNSKVVVTFSETMDATTMNTDSFTVKDASGTAVTGTISLNADTSIASFTPDSNLTANTVYTATITTAVTSKNNVSLENNYVWSFTTGATADFTAPTVSSTDPADTATGVPINRNITAEFNEALDPSTISSASFTLTADSGATAVAGTVSYLNKLVTFDPDSDLVASKQYTATLTTAIKDIAGNTLAVNYVWTFTASASAAVALGPDPVNLLTAGNFTILTKTGITNVPTSAITGDIGASPITAAAMDNVTCAEITGTIYGSDNAYTGSGDTTCFAGAAPDNTLVANAILDMGTAYTDAAGRTTPDFTELYAGDISGRTLVPGLYKWGTNVLINSDVTLSGGPNDVWIFQVAGDVIQASSTSVFLNGGAQAKNVFWQVGGGTGVALDTTATFTGVVLAEKAITVNTNAVVNGRLLSQTSVTLDKNTVTPPAP